MSKQHDYLRAIEKISETKRREQLEAIEEETTMFEPRYYKHNTTAAIERVITQERADALEKNTDWKRFYYTFQPKRETGSETFRRLCEEKPQEETDADKLVEPSFKDKPKEETLPQPPLNTREECLREPFTIRRKSDNLLIEIMTRDDYRRYAKEIGSDAWETVIPSTFRQPANEQPLAKGFKDKLQEEIDRLDEDSSVIAEEVDRLSENLKEMGDKRQEYWLMLNAYEEFTEKYTDTLL